MPTGFQSVGWTYGNAPALVCNGIIVKNDHKSSPPLAECESHFGKIIIRPPAISVFDPNGKLPLTLDRLHVDFERISFTDVLHEDVLRNIAAYLLVCAPSNLRESSDFDITVNKEIRSHPSLAGAIDRIPWVFAPQGISLLDPDLFCSLGVGHVIEVEHTKDMSLAAKFAKGHEYAIAVTPKSLWEMVKKKDKHVAIKGAKRGTIQERATLDEVDKERVDRIMELLRTSRSWHDSDQPVENGGLFRNLFKSRSSSEHNRAPNWSAEEFLHNFERLIFRIRQMCWQVDDDSHDKLFRDLTRRCELCLARTHEVTPGLEKAYLFLESIREDSDERTIAGVVQRAADAIEGRHAKRGKISHNEARRLFERIHRRIRDIRSHRHPHVLDELLHRLHNAIEESSRFGKDLPSAVHESLELADSISPADNKEFETDGDVSNSALDWKSLSQSSQLRDNWSIVEYEINQSVQVSGVSNTLARVWLEVSGRTVIPYDMEERKRQLSHVWARSDMRRHLEHWESALTSIRSGA